MSNILSLLFYLTFCIHTVFGQSKIDTIPFILTTSNNISIQATINQKDTLNLMFHTAVNSISLTTDAAKDLSSIQFDQSENVKSWGGEHTAQYAEGNIVQIGSYLNESETIWLSKHSGPGTDGKFGPNFFGNHILEINYDQNILVVHEDLPHLTNAYSKETYTTRQGMMFLKGKSRIDQEDFENEFLIHSGYAGTLLFDDEFVAKHKFGTSLEIIEESELKDSYGNIIKTKKAILPLMSIGNITLENLPIGFFDGAIGRQKMSVLGGDILKRFNIIIDPISSSIYLQPNSLFGRSLSKS